MTASPIAVSQASDGNWRVWWVPSGSSPTSAAILNGGTAKDVTYSFTGAGWNYGVTQEEATDSRLTLAQVLTQPGRSKDTLEVQYVRSVDAGSANATLTPGLAGFFVVRRGVTNVTDAAASQKVDVITVKLGRQRPDAPTENGVDTITQGVYITSATQENVTLAA